MISPYIYSGLPAFKQAMVRMGAHYSDPKHIIECACIALDIDPLKFNARSRKRNLVQARHIAMYLILELNPDLTLKKMANHYFGGMDHSTIIYGRELYKDLYGLDKEFTTKANAVKNRLML